MVTIAQKFMMSKRVIVLFLCIPTDNLYSTTPNVNCTIYICEKITENNGDFQENGGKEDEG